MKITRQEQSACPGDDTPAWHPSCPISSTRLVYRKLLCTGWSARKHFGYLHIGSRRNNLYHHATNNGIAVHGGINRRYLVNEQSGMEHSSARRRNAVLYACPSRFNDHTLTLWHFNHVHLKKTSTIESCKIFQPSTIIFAKDRK